MLYAVFPVCEYMDVYLDLFQYFSQKQEIFKEIDNKNKNVSATSARYYNHGVD